MDRAPLATSGSPSLPCAAKRPLTRRATLPGAMQQRAVMPSDGPLLVKRENDAAANLDPMVFWSWTVTGLLTAAQITLGVIGAAQTGRCVPSDPIPDCPHAHGLAGIGFALFVPTLVTECCSLACRRSCSGG